MNKKILVTVVSAMMLVLLMAAGVLAAQTVNLNADPTVSDYAYTPKSFTNDGTANYPNEIYLPNENSPKDYRIHSNYTSTTDACASCHATHTGVGESLLQWGTVYDTCMSCHDGTVTTTYDVKSGKIGTTLSRTSAGLFDTTAGSGSNHNATGALDIYAAPGGAGTSGVDTLANPNKEGNKGKTVSWDVEFSCQSCHSPHGLGGNARLLNPDVNGYAWKQYNDGKTKNVTLTVYDSVYYVSDWNNDGVKDTWLQGYPYSFKVFAGVTQDKTATIDNSAGFSKIMLSSTPAGGTRISADFFAGVAVRMTIANYLDAGETVTHGSGLDTFCGACHTDYNTQGNQGNGVSGSSGTTLTGTYNEAYRHQVGMTNYYSSADKLTVKNMKVETGNVITCGTCHVAHGTDKTYWSDMLKNVNSGSLPTGIVDGDLVELAGSSALKRLPNMGVCETCHQKGTANQGYENNTSSYAYNQIDATYVGSTTCQSCHSGKYTGWQDTLHSKMIGQGASAVLDVVYGRVYGSDGTQWYQGNGTTVASLFRNQDSTAFAPKDVVLTIGTKWKQRYLVRNLTDTGYTFLNMQFNVASGLYEAYGNKSDWDKNCITCHSTGYKVTAQTDLGGGVAEDTTVTWNELNVGCEDCHGPGSKHKNAPSALNIWNPSAQSAAAVSKSCGYCHNRGESETHKIQKGDGVSLILREDSPAPLNQTHEPWEDWTTYGINVPGIVGDSYAQGSVAGTASSTSLDDMFYNPNGSGLYDDKKHHQQYQSFAQTGAGHNTTMSCASCHNSHGRNAEKEPLKQLGADLCSSCHGTTYTIAANMPMTGKTVNNLYVRTHSFSAIPTAQPAGALNPANP